MTATRRRLPAGRCSSDVLERAADPEEWERFERQLRSTGYCRRPVRLRGRVDAVDAATGEVVTVVLDRARAGRDAAEVLRQPSRGGLPVVRARPTAATRSSSWRPGCAAARACPSRSPSIRWCSLTLTAPSFGPVHSRRVGRRQGAALPAAARRRGLPARRPAGVRRGPRRGRSAPRRAAVPGVLRLRARGAVERAGAGAVAADGEPAPARARAADRRHAAAAARARARVVRQGRRVPAPRRAALPLRAAARRARSRGRAELVEPPPAEFTARAARSTRSAPRSRARVGALPDARATATAAAAGVEPARAARDPVGRAGRGARARTRGARRRRARATSRSTRRRAPRRSAG